jgi:hypothetical protein
MKDSEFMKALHPSAIGIGFGGICVMYMVLALFGAPVIIVYGFMRGFGRLPHFMVLEVVGTFLGRFYFQKKFGRKEFLKSASTVLAGYFTGVGLIGMATIALRLIKAAVSSTPF